MRKSGFTLVELIVAALAVSVLAVTMGSMLFFAMKHIKNNTTAIELQRDATFALDMLYRSLQGASASQVTWSGTTLALATNAARANPQSFRVASGDLIYDPDTTSAGDSVTLIDGKVQSFNVSFNGNMASISLRLQDDEESLTVTNNNVYMRYIE